MRGPGRPAIHPVAALAARQARSDRPGNAVTDLVDQGDPERVRAERGLPRAAFDGMRTFYDQLDPGPRVCTGTACAFAGPPPPPGLATARCLGHCYAAPVRSPLPEEPIPRMSLASPPIVLRNLLGPRGDDYDLPDDGPAILAAVSEAGLRGRGGAAYPTGAKWRSAALTPAPDRFVVCNGDEGDPGSYTDRLLLEEDPHAVLAGMLAASRAIGATRGIVYLRAEYPVARRRMEEAIREAPLGTFQVSVVSGGGSYVCGEETALLRSIEGLRGAPSPKPPYPAQIGLLGLPTVVQNVETLAIVPWVVQNRRVAGTKAVCLSGVVARPGLVEAPLGTRISDLLAAVGGPAAGRVPRMALVGGPMGRVLPASAFDTALSFEALPGMGHAGICVLDCTPGELTRHLMVFAADESCGNCAPCRIGTARLVRMRDRAALERLFDTLCTGSLCGFGLSVARPLRDLVAAFGDAVFA